ncbi:glyoxalase [Actinoplanes sp. OR16]|uniref:VOC family protein n=1 Tax=Actinoplanes sp. OR16 TaxID=946334 RepID=UPI000F71629E|nr:VOC family protein [Actinoplanes sp. OR16]BBH67833.1 glyoxalase [Actinoplanes sp. OR16]
MAVARYAGFSLDTDDPQALAEFYRRLFDTEFAYTSEEFVYLKEPSIGFVKVDEYVPPTWPSPDVPKQAHLELGVDDLDAGEAAVIELGATKADVQPQPDRWRVMLDPAGHPFCISVMS